MHSISGTAKSAAQTILATRVYGESKSVLWSVPDSASVILRRVNCVKGCVRNTLTFSCLLRLAASRNWRCEIPTTSCKIILSVRRQWLGKVEWVGCNE